METHRYTNSLIHESSPYLLQHAHNPVNWMPWGEAALNRAQAENKLLLISIGYAACHWCHVMEHESFEQEQVAGVMNEHYVCIKVDREERPDVDQVYMTAVQLITQSGGWPLNVVALPDGRPIWGGTYFPAESLIESLRQIASYYRQAPEKTHDYARKLSLGIEQSLIIPADVPDTKITTGKIEAAILQWQSSFDLDEGGKKGAPKFLMPGNLLFQLRWAHQHHDTETEAFVRTSLRKMAFGGIYDQIGGGFSRYSTDSRWKVPHFEKMLYDNGQMLSLYARAFQKFQDPLYRQVVEETVAWLKREMRSPESVFYSSLDADSEGEEGKYYVWEKPKLKDLIGADFQLFEAFYNVNSTGYWEDGKHILLRTETEEEFAANHQVGPDELAGKVRKWNSILLEERSKRIRPALDDKILTSWNALVITGLTDAYRAFGEPEYLSLAIQNAGFISENLLGEKGLLRHSWKDGVCKPEGFLEDAALFIRALIALFEVTGMENYLRQAGELTKTTVSLFYDTDAGFFWYSPAGQGNLISRSMEVYDNVIPSSNSVMAGNLVRLGHLLDEREYLTMAAKMLGKTGDNALEYPSGHSNWLEVALDLWDEQFEVVLTGPGAQQAAAIMQKNYLPNCIFCFGDDDSLPLLKDRIKTGETRIYVCRDNTCLLPVSTPDEAMKLLAISF
ncbi:MAG: thioredoxin domain-containing protein [Prolixibacteraceae bacterium]